MNPEKFTQIQVPIQAIGILLYEQTQGIVFEQLETFKAIEVTVRKKLLP